MFTLFFHSTANCSHTATKSNIRVLLNASGSKFRSSSSYQGSTSSSSRSHPSHWLNTVENVYPQGADAAPAPTAAGWKSLVNALTTKGCNSTVRVCRFQRPTASWRRSSRADAVGDLRGGRWGAGIRVEWSSLGCNDWLLPSFEAGELAINDASRAKVTATLRPRPSATNRLLEKFY